MTAKKRRWLKILLRFLIVVLALVALAAALVWYRIRANKFDRLDHVQDLGPLTFDDVIIGHDGGYSFAFQGQSIWNFGDTAMRRYGEDGWAWRSSLVSRTADEDASDGIGPFQENTDALGVPLEFLPFTDEELAFNNAHRAENCQEDCGARYALWPAQMLNDAANDRILVFYSKLTARPGFLNFKTLGWSIAVWDGTDNPPVRPVIHPDAADPTLLFQNGEPYFGVSALLIGTDVYAYACDTASWKLVAPCKVARVPLDAIFNPDAWTYYAGDNRWSHNVSDAVEVMDGATIMSVHWNAYLGKYIAVHSRIFSNDVVMHTADRPEGPWSKPYFLFKCLSPMGGENWGSYSALAHAEYAQENGRIEYVTYYRPGEAFQGDELRLVKVVFKE